MIEFISISKTATYGGDPQELSGLSKFNYLFGSNGTGKTTIGRIILNAAGFPSCRVVWKGGVRLQALVYNHDFIERNFNQLVDLKGVFTLGEEQAETLVRIAALKAEVDEKNEKIANLKRTLQGVDGGGGKKRELADLESDLTERCWVQQTKYKDRFRNAFEGYRGSKETFKGKVLQENASNIESLQPLSALESKAASLFGVTPKREDLVQTFDAAKLIEHESNAILHKKVVGKKDVDIAIMIERLGNSDWVREGMHYHSNNNNVCPFCQQETSEWFAKSLEEYFDETYLTDTRILENILVDYSNDCKSVDSALSFIMSSPSNFLDVEKLKLEKELLDSKINVNLQRLAEKKKEASRIIVLDSLSDVIMTIHSLIEMANRKIAEHNNMVSNLSNERNRLVAQIWRFILEEMKVDLEDYKRKKEGLIKAIESINTQIARYGVECGEAEKEIRNLEKMTTSVQPTVDGINSLLVSFGFQGFRIAVASDGKSYKLVRPDGAAALTTLSEGEKTFVTFLYFYYLLKGSDSESGTTTDRVVVFDDPVSSLDSDILFIVSSLIKGLFEEVREEKGCIKQIFILTHNVYFHKEVTFSPNRRNGAMNEETFWVVRKPETVSKIEKCDNNPISTSYELLWSEVKRPDRSALTIQNTLRRILENYFKILGGIDLDGICEKFDGKDRLICKSLLCWVNDGSHFALDDLYMAIDDSQIANYLQVFRMIFEKEGHLPHYRMMMGEAFKGEVGSVGEVVIQEYAKAEVDYSAGRW